LWPSPAIKQLKKNPGAGPGLCNAHFVPIISAIIYGSVFATTSHVTLSLTLEPSLKPSVTLKIWVPSVKSSPVIPGHRKVWPLEIKVPGATQFPKKPDTSTLSNIQGPLLRTQNKGGYSIVNKVTHSSAIPFVIEYF
jgi:hypothetical protein